MDVDVEVSGITEEWTGQDYIDYSIEFSDSPVSVNFSDFGFTWFGLIQYKLLTVMGQFTH